MPRETRSVLGDLGLHNNLSDEPRRSSSSFVWSVRLVLLGVASVRLLTSIIIGLLASMFRRRQLLEHSPAHLDMPNCERTNERTATATHWMRIPGVVDVYVLATSARRRLFRALVNTAGAAGAAV